jgi:hypothetical protein
VTDIDTNSAESSGEDREKQFESLMGILLAIFAAVLSLNDLASAKFEGDQMMAASAQVSAYNWYQSKSIKESLAEGQRDMARMLAESGAIDPENEAGVAKLVTALDEEVTRYDKEKTEILRGSKAVGEANWAQDVDGKMGQITGAQEYEATALGLDAAGNYYDLANLFLQLCLVFGALCLIFNQPAQRKFFFAVMNVTGVIGTAIAVYALMRSLPFM